jgi:hypothetical protein
MDEEEPALLHEPDLMLALLRAASRGPAGLEEATAQLLANLAVAGEPAPADPLDLRSRLARAASLLVAAGALASAADGSERFRLTERGEHLLAEHPDGVDPSVLRDLPAFRAFLAERTRGQPEADPCLPAYLGGLRAFAQGRSLADNPYPTDTADHLAWENGWSEAHDRT